MNSISVIFAGTPDFALPSLQKLIDDKDIDVKLVITQPDKPVGRAQILTPPPVKVLAKKNNIPVWQPSDINAEKIPVTDCDFLVTVAYGQIIKESILNIPNIA
ncbi:MAG: methionyl-tRNA formyltransferase, partial [Candidatus Peribacteraceae bacterium]|nr:methionyl-tRNA formyltransferase [Candidatus Peribacteraceae bacterium]